MRFVGLALAALATGCLPSFYGVDALRFLASKEVECPADQLTVADHQGGITVLSATAPDTWTATGCGREWDCRHTTTGYTSRTVCEERPASRAATLTKVVKDRLALETGCPLDRIEVESTAAWKRGDETAFRLRGCGKPYVCTTAPGRTDCKAALSE